MFSYTTSYVSQEPIPVGPDQLEPSCAAGATEILRRKLHRGMNNADAVSWNLRDNNGW